MNQNLNGNYNLFSIDLPENFIKYHSMYELGKYYLEEIKKYQSQGPYIIGGYSFGGNLSFEIATQLENLGENIAKIIMFDSHPPEAYNSEEKKEINYLDVFPDILASYFNKNLAKMDYSNKTLEELLIIMRKKKIIDTQLNNEQLIGFYNKWIYNHKLLKHHHVNKKINSDLILFNAEEAENNTILNKLGIALFEKNQWSKYFTGETFIIPVKGNHYTMFNNYYVKHLSYCFDEIILKHITEK